MPHFGLMDEDALGPERAALMRARLHIRGGRRRLGQGKISYGIITLYDALVHAMQWHALSPILRPRLKVNEGEDLGDEPTLFKILVRSGLIRTRFDFAAFNDLVDRALAFELDHGFDYRPTLAEVESVMADLGVMPFDEGELPPEDPSTF